jgi:nitrite reductase (NADH) small subunit
MQANETLVDAQKLCGIHDIPQLGAKRFDTAWGPVAVIRAFNGEVYAIHDSCPHKQGPLSEGMVHGSQITCPLHNWTIDLATGEATGADEGQVRCFNTTIDNDDVWISLKKPM